MKTAFAILALALTVAACATPRFASSAADDDLIFGCAPSEKIVFDKDGDPNCVTIGYDDPETARAADGL